MVIYFQDNFNTEALGEDPSLWVVDEQALCEIEISDVEVIDGKSVLLYQTDHDVFAKMTKTLVDPLSVVGEVIMAVYSPIEAVGSDLWLKLLDANGDTINSVNINNFAGIGGEISVRADYYEGGDYILRPNDFIPLRERFLEFKMKYNPSLEQVKFYVNNTYKLTEGMGSVYLKEPKSIQVDIHRNQNYEGYGSFYLDNVLWQSAVWDDPPSANVVLVGVANEGLIGLRAKKRSN